MNNQQLLNDMLNDDLAQTVIRELGIQNEPAEDQAEAISALGENLMMRLVLETLKQLPPETHAEFESLMERGDMESMRDFILPHIPDWDKFVRREVDKEFEATKTRIREIEAGVQE